MMVGQKLHSSLFGSAVTLSSGDLIITGRRKEEPTRRFSHKPVQSYKLEQVASDETWTVFALKLHPHTGQGGEGPCCRRME